MRPLCEYCLPPRRVATLTAWQGCDEVYVCEEHTPNRGNDMTLATLPVAIDAVRAALAAAYRAAHDDSYVAYAASNAAYAASDARRADLAAAYRAALAAGETL